eukprot:UN12531
MIKLGTPKSHFSNFLKYGENKKSHVFTNDNTIVLKKRSQFLVFMLNLNCKKRAVGRSVLSLF